MTARAAWATIDGVDTPKSAEESDMQTPIVTEMTRETYVEARKRWHMAQVELVRESLLRAGHADTKRP